MTNILYYGFVTVQVFGAYLYLDKTAPTINRAMGLILIIAPFTYIAMAILKAVEKIAETISRGKWISSINSYFHTWKRII